MENNTGFDKPPPHYHSNGLCVIFLFNIIDIKTHTIYCPVPVSGSKITFVPGLVVIK